VKTHRINRLDPLISNQIAAGEVVERPASVIKELVENAIDAEATKIDIEIEGGGIHLIRVRDNGHGIVKDDLELAFCRHATSKIESTDDLSKIMSLGFRGEALASIVSVSKCRLTSKFKTNQDAWQIHIHPDLSASLALASHSVGTTIEVSDLFYNTPVRRKFLRSEKSESLAIEEMIKRLALAYPHVTFTYKQNQKLVRQYSGSNHGKGIEARVAKICGQAFMEQAVSLKLENAALSLYGWIGLPTLSRRQADCQYFFVNRRMVRDRLLNHVIKSLYQQQPLHKEGTYPAYVLFLDLDPTEVDVNVHPTKQEVRFSQPSFIHDFISKGVQQAWSELPIQVPIAPQISLLGADELSEPVLTGEFSEARQKTYLESDSTHLHAKRYILVESEAGLQIVDHKRFKFALLATYFEQRKGTIPMKPLLFPLKVKSSYKLKLTLAELTKLQAYGFRCRNEGDSLTLCEQPVLVEEPLSESLFISIIDSFKQDKSDEWLKKSLFPLCSDQVLRSLDWSSLNLSQIPSVWLSHADIEKALEV
jgi:DNA mismatch repair protein MutL